MKNFFSSIIAELKETKWPTKIESLNMTLYTIFFCTALTLMMVGLDLVFAKLRDLFLNI